MTEPHLANDLLLRALARQPTERTPLWVMRQAGRYLPEYRKLRKQAGSFLKLCRTPELACAATMQPLERYALDAAIVFSDILVIPDALGLQLDFVDGEGPQLRKPLQTEQAVNELGELDLDKVDYVCAAIKECQQALARRVPLIGFTGGPFTLACYMIDGRGGEFFETRRMLHARPDLFEAVLARNADAVVKLLTAQAEAGADVLMIFESWAGLVPVLASSWCLLEPLGRIMAGLHKRKISQPVILFLRNAGNLNEAASKLGVAALGIDWRSDLAAQSRALARQVSLQGNLDPAVLMTDEQTIRTQARRVVTEYAAEAGHIFNLGAGIHRLTPPEHLATLIDEVKLVSSRRYRDNVS